MNVDFAPTFLDFAGVDIPSDIQGASLKPILVNEGKTPADWRKAAYYHYYEYPAEHSVKTSLWYPYTRFQTDSFLQRY